MFKFLLATFHLSTMWQDQYGSPSNSLGFCFVQLSSKIESEESTAKHFLLFPNNCTLNTISGDSPYSQPHIALLLHGTRTLRWFAHNKLG